MTPDRYGPTQDEEHMMTLDPLLGNQGNGRMRRRGADESQQHQFKDNYTYVSATSFTHPTNESTTYEQKQPLQSQTLGGYGPIDPTATTTPLHHQNNHQNHFPPSIDPSKQKRPKLTTRLLRGCTTCLRTTGCSSHEMLSQEGPSGSHYRDDFNDQPKSCSIGTGEENGTWMNRSDKMGTIMGCMVWFLLGYSAITVTFLAETGGIHTVLAMIYVVLCTLALACHAKTQFTDPGTVPVSAQPVESIRLLNPHERLSMCSQCQTFKPPFSHHCRICNRCISRMDHHCPWMNNCIGAGNFKHFILFLVYTWLCTCMSMCLFGWNYFFCVTEDCAFSIVLVQLARVVSVLSTGALLFTSSMIMNVTYGILTGIGTIDRLKKKANDTVQLSDELPIPLKDIFGIAGYHTWFFPMDPVFEDFDKVMGFSTPQRLLREQMKEKGDSGGGGSGRSVMTQGSIVHV